MRWSNNLAYTIGLIATDGNLSIDGRHMELTSKDKEQIENFVKILGLKNKISKKYSSYSHEKKYYHVQFGNIQFYRFLTKIGLMPNKTKRLGLLKIPARYFADYLRGYLDGDGCTYSYWDPRWKSSYMLYTAFVSASEKHLIWIEYCINKYYGLKGKLRFQGKSTYLLRYAKQASIILLGKIYYKANLICLNRKRLKIKRSLDIINQEAGVEELVDSQP